MKLLRILCICIFSLAVNLQVIANDEIDFNELVATNFRLPLDWKVGDVAEYNVSAGILGKGKMIKTVVQDTGKALWILEEMNIPTHKETIKKLYNKEDGKVLSVVRSGEAQNPEDSKIQIITQENTQITVPAGTFNVLHITGKSVKTPRIELWSNPDATVSDGTIKMIMTSKYYKITSELTKFTHAH